MSDLREYEVLAKTQAFRRHVDKARSLFERAAEIGPLAVSVSWGKDSIAMLDLAIEVLGPEVRAMNLASPYALPGFEHVRDHFAARCNLTVLESRRSLADFIAWCHEIGLPHERDRSVQKGAVRKMKVGPAERWVAEQGIAVQCLGMRIAEKGPRAKRLKERGPIYQVASGSWRASPLCWWSTKEVWAYLVSRGLPWPRLYDCETHGFTRERLRNTGWLSTDDAHDGRILWLRAHFPEQYRMLVDAFPLVATMS